MKKIILPALALMSFITGFANVRLPKFFGNQMVLQRNQKIPVWGWANKNEKVTVTFNQQTKTVNAGKDGKWRVDLEPENAGGPFTLTVKGKNQLTISDVLVGEVWICSGQSNMEFHVSSVMNFEKEIQSAHYPQIRQVEIIKDVSGLPKEDVTFDAAWKTATPENVKNFTAVGYFFAEKLYNELHVPIGLIHTSWGGTEVETWTSRKGFENSNEFKDMISKMPVVDLDSLSILKKKETDKRIADLQGGLPQSSAIVAQWKDLSFDDSKWPAMNVPGLWETQSLPDVDGIVWLRKTIEIAPEDAGKTAQIELGQIDDSDDSYVNGTKVGSTYNKYAQNRVYAIPAGVLKAGKNVIAVRVEDTGGGGGIYGDPKAVQLTIGAKVISLTGSWKFQVESLAKNSSAINPNSNPTLLYNAMINPLIPYAIRGVIWYQGESNADRAYEYRIAFPLMITDWRKQWNEGDFPFYFVQLASYDANGGNSKKGSSWAELREAQAMTLSLPNTGMAVTTDIGESHDIHPKNKQDAGRRLAAIALYKTYNIQKEYSGPVYQSFKVNNDKVEISFSHVGNGLWVKDQYGYLKGFEIAGADQKFHYAKATIEGDRIIAWQDGITNPVAVRYNWADDAADGNLYNKDGFPAAPFRTDSWKAVTEGVKYRNN